MNLDDTIASLDFFTELAGIAMKYDTAIANELTAQFERRQAPRIKNTDSRAAKKGPKNLLTAAASVQDCAA
jgi:hypothetical protein